VIAITVAAARNRSRVVRSSVRSPFQAAAMASIFTSHRGSKMPVLALVSATALTRPEEASGGGVIYLFRKTFT
jgi:hypothetical protein